MVVRLAVNDVELITWQRVTIRDTIEAIADSWSMSTPNTQTSGGDYLPVRPFDRVEIWTDDQVVLVGHVDKVDASVRESESSVTASGRSLAGDLVDCSAKIKGGSLRDVTALQVAQQLAQPYSITVTAASGVDVGPPFDKFAIEPGETVFAAISRACKARALLPATVRETGMVELVSTPADRSADDLIMGKNVKSASAAWDVSGRYSQYQVTGQRPPRPGSRDVRRDFSVDGIASDSEVPRHRPLNIRADKRVDAYEAERRAQWEAAYRAGQSSSISVELSSWRQSDGSLWRSNLLVSLDIPQFGISGYEMLVSETSLEYDISNGEKCTLKLVHPDTYRIPAERDATTGRQPSAWRR